MNSTSYNTLLNIDVLFKEASKLYENTKDKGFYVSSNDRQGLHVGIYKPTVSSNLWVNYVPEDEYDAEIISKSGKEEFKVFYCDNCPILESFNVIKKENCIGSGIKLPKTSNIANLINKTIKIDGHEFLICATAVQYYYNHLLFQSSNHISSYLVFEKYSLFKSVFNALEVMSIKNPLLKMYFNGNFGSNRYHFHTHITDQKTNYIDEFHLTNVNVNKNFKKGIVKYRVISSPDLKFVYSESQKYSRLVFNVPDYKIDKKYLSFAFIYRNGIYASFLTTGNNARVIPANLNEKIPLVRLISPSAIVNLSDMVLDADLPKVMSYIENFILNNEIYEHIEDDIIDYDLPTTPNIMECLENKFYNKEWDNEMDKLLIRNATKIRKCKDNGGKCTPNKKAIYAFLFTKFMVAYMRAIGVRKNTSKETFRREYRKMLSQNPDLTTIIIEFGFVYMRDTQGSVMSNGSDFLKGSVGSLIFTKPFKNFLFISSKGDLNEKIDFFDMTTKIDEWIKGERMIGEASGMGSIIKSSFSYNLAPIKDKPFHYNFVIKTNKFPNSRPEFIQEVANGLIINSLRQIIPNFPLTLGGFGCNKDPSAGLNLCKGNVEGSYVILEYIVGDTFKKYIRTHSKTEIFYGILQTMFGLHYAQKKVEFTHYDMHSDNVMITDIGRTVYYKYYIGNNDYILPTSVNCFVIDFGWSHVSGVNYSTVLTGTAQKYGFTSSKFYPHRDLYTFLLGCFARFCSYKTPQEIEGLTLSTSPLGNMFRLVWESYPELFNSDDCRNFDKIANHIASELTKNSNLSSEMKNGLVLSILTKCSTDSNRFPLFLPIDYPTPVGTHLESPLAFINYIYPNLPVVNIPDNTTIYNWGDISETEVGCVTVSSPAPNINLINKVQQYMRT